LEIIPVIDILGAQVVHARRGHRESYTVLRTPLSLDAKPVSVVQGLLRLFPFQTVYVADLDALMGKGTQIGLIKELVATFPALDFWVDHGFPGEDPIYDAPNERLLPVIGSESLSDDHLNALPGMGQRFILSLDFRDQLLVGTETLLNRVDLWPERVILMNLSRVGSFEGPDFRSARQFISLYPAHRCVVAGGVRHGSDLDELARMGASAVLLASALHTGAIGSEDLHKYRDFGPSLGLAR
jgi:phosphoribosylformimino-5-aminoimidazole carboxamide ribotide isomerase